MATAKKAEETQEVFAQAAPAKQEEPQVRFVGGNASIREITKAQWESAGISEQDTVRWTRQNKFSIPKSRFTESALDLLRSQDGFEIDN